MMNNYPYIQKMSDGKYHLFCGVCHMSNPSVEYKDAGMMRISTIVCDNYCSPKGTKNQICGFGDIPKFAEMLPVPDDEKKQAVIDVCEILGIDPNRV